MSVALAAAAVCQHLPTADDRMTVSNIFTAWLKTSLKNNHTADDVVRAVRAAPLLWTSTRQTLVRVVLTEKLWLAVAALRAACGVAGGA